MKVLGLSIGGHTYALAPDQDVTSLQAQMVDAVRRGGGMVDIPVASDEKVSALLTPGISVIFFTRELPNDDWAVEKDVEVVYHDNDLLLDFF